MEDKVKRMREDGEQSKRASSVLAMVMRKLSSCLALVTPTPWMVSLIMSEAQMLRMTIVYLQYFAFLDSSQTRKHRERGNKKVGTVVLYFKAVWIGRLWRVYSTLSIALGLGTKKRKMSTGGKFVYDCLSALANVHIIPWHRWSHTQCAHGISIERVWCEKARSNDIGGVLGLCDSFRDKLFAASWYSTRRQDRWIHLEVGWSGRTD
jgi:hypothetical protein